MKIKSITIGGWFQRTTLHLTEIYDFLNENNSSSLKFLDHKLLQSNFKKLKIKTVERVADEIEYLKVVAGDLQIKITEDGLITLTTLNVLPKEVDKKILSLKNFYEKDLSSSISYIFSRGAPVPKELAKIDTIYPFIFSLEDAEYVDILEIFKLFNDELSSKIENADFGIYKGKKVMVIKNVNDKEAENILIETEIFFREFKTQMAKYLHIHREIWEKIKKIKELTNIQGKQILLIKDELAEEEKTINLIEARINQMPIYLKTRAKITNLEKFSTDLHPLFQYKFETLLDTHDYVKHLWAMTKNYLKSAIEILTSLQTESTKVSISSLTVITTVGVVAGIVNYMTRDSLPSLTYAGGEYFVLLLAITFLINLLVVNFYKFKKYKIKK